MLLIFQSKSTIQFSFWCAHTQLLIPKNLSESPLLLIAVRTQNTPKQIVRHCYIFKTRLIKGTWPTTLSKDNYQTSHGYGGGGHDTLFLLLPFLLPLFAPLPYFPPNFASFKDLTLLVFSLALSASSQALSTSFEALFIFSLPPSQF
jgi:hypothetical protein